jgi:hypothetical protein
MEAWEMEMYWRDEKPKPRPLMRSQLRKMSQSEGAGDESGQHPLASFLTSCPEYRILDVF